MLSRRQRYLDTVLKHFWNRWRKEYLTELREHHCGKKTPRARVIKKSDVVCVHEEFTPHQSWKIGLVQDLIIGRDQVVRAAVVQVLSHGRGIDSFAFFSLCDKPSTDPLEVLSTTSSSSTLTLVIFKPISIEFLLLTSLRQKF